jgi:hypothetical protein
LSNCFTTNVKKESHWRQSADAPERLGNFGSSNTAASC